MHKRLGHQIVRAGGKTSAPSRAGKEIALLALVPLYPAELEVKLSQGSGVLIDGFDRHGVTELLDPARPCTV